MYISLSLSLFLGVFLSRVSKGGLENHHQQQSGKGIGFRSFLVFVRFLVFTFWVCRLRVVASFPKLHFVFCIVKLRYLRLETTWESVVKT